MIQFELGTKYQYDTPEGTLTPTGIRLVKAFLASQVTNQGDWLALNPNQTSPYMPTLTEEFDWVWVTKEGKLPKRLAKEYKSVYSLKMPIAVQEQLGNLAKPHANHKATYHFDFTNRFNWQAGDFGDSTSCFWRDHSAARQIISNNGGYAVRFYNSQGLGFARAWLAKVDDFAIVFNGYGLATVEIARILAAFWGDLPYKYVDVENYRSAHGILYINSGGYAIGDVDFDEYDLEWDGGYICYDCGDMVDEDDYHYGANDEVYCSECFYNTFEYCERCGETIYREDGQELGYSIYCEHCFSQRGFRCHACENTFELDNAHRYQGHVYCEDCLVEEKPPKK